MRAAASLPSTTCRALLLERETDSSSVTLLVVVIRARYDSTGLITRGFRPDHKRRDLTTVGVDSLNTGGICLQKVSDNPAPGTRALFVESYGGLMD